MATLTLTNVPPATLAYLAARATRARRTVEEEALSMLAPEARPDVPEFIPSPDITAPFDPELPGPRVRVVPREIPHPPLEFWFDEDKGRE